MRAWIVGKGGVLTLEEVERERLGSHDVRVKVTAVGVNRADLMQRNGKYPAPRGTRTDILGLEFAGEIIELGTKVWKWSVGDRVMAIITGASYAQEVVIDARLLMSIPNGMDDVQAASIPESFLTAFDALFMQLKCRRGERVLMHAIGSGLGDAVYQLCRIWGIELVGTTRSAWKLEAYPELVQGIIVRKGDFLAQLEGKVDAVVDVVGGAYLEQNIRALHAHGRMLVLGLLGGVSASCSLGLILVKNIEIKGRTLRNRSFEEKLLLVKECTKTLIPLFAKKALCGCVDKVFSFEDVEEAHQYLKDNKNRGKVILKWM